MKIKNFNQLNESSYNDFLDSYSEEINNAITLLIKLKKYEDSDDDSIQNKLEKKLVVYDTNVPETIERWIYKTPSKDDIVNFAIQNQNRYGTEPKMILFAIEDYAEAFGVYLRDDEDEDEENNEFYEGSFQFDNDDVENENVEVDNFTSRYYDNYDDEEPAANEDDLQNFSSSNKKIHLFEDFK